MSRCIACNNPVEPEYEYISKPELCARCSIIVQLAVRDKTPMSCKEYDHAYVHEGLTRPTQSCE